MFHYDKSCNDTGMMLVPILQLVFQSLARSFALFVMTFFSKASWCNARKLAVYNTYTSIDNVYFRLQAKGNSMITREESNEVHRAQSTLKEGTHDHFFWCFLMRRHKDF